MGRDVVTGVGFLLRGLGMYARRPRLMLLGILPALIAGALLIGALVALGYFSDDLADAVTPFADDWSASARRLVRVAAQVGVFGVGLLLSVILFTGLTLAIGEPFYEAISKSVDDGLGGVPGGEIDVPFWRSLPRGLADSARLFVTTALIGIPLFAAGFIPVVGETAVPVIGALVGGWFIAVEVTGVPFERRGMRLRERRQLLRARRGLAVGFGTATFVCFLIPLGAVLVMPAAVAGATLLCRRVTVGSGPRGSAVAPNVG